MKVITPGEKGGSWHPHVTCTGHGNGDVGCNAVLEINGDDLFHTRSHDYTGDYTDYITIECPECGNWTDINKKNTEIPYGLENKVLGMPVRTLQDKKEQSSDK